MKIYSYALSSLFIETPSQGSIRARLFSCSMCGGGAEPATLNIFPFDTKIEIKLSMMLYILLKNLSVEKIAKKNTSIFPFISISIRALIEKFVKMTNKNEV